MDEPDGSPPQSICMISAAESYPKPQLEKEDAQLDVPYQELAGEAVYYVGRTDDGVLAISNYRLFVQKESTNVETSVPVNLIELAQTRDLFHLFIQCKDASTVKCSFRTSEQCSDWQRRIQLATAVPEKFEGVFALAFRSLTSEHRRKENCRNGSGSVISTTAGAGHFNGVPDGGAAVLDEPNFEHAVPQASGLDNSQTSVRLMLEKRRKEEFDNELNRLGFQLYGSWRTTTANEKFQLCPSYPAQMLVPSCITDEILNNVANFRSSRRLPAVVWRHRRSGAVLARCSQPEVGWLGWRNAKDEQLLKALADACAHDRAELIRHQQQHQEPPQQHEEQQMGCGDKAPASCDSDSSNNSIDGSHEEVPLDEVRKILIVDARSYASAVTNRARGGGCECIEYYPCAEIEFMNLGNIHVIRKSFQALRQLCASPPDVPNWYSLLEKSMWMHHLSGLLAASMTVCVAIEKKERPVLVHCSDGWDRTPQIVATAQLCLDPYYRTVEGFRILVEREWLNFGHKFADRCGHGPGSDEANERCPVFLQWLDLVHQIHKQFPCCFEFNMAFLIKLAQHSLSCLFGTFLCNTLKERIDNSIFERTFSVWPFLAGAMYRNPLYVPNSHKVLWPAHNVRDLFVWSEVYVGSLGCNNNNNGASTTNGDGIPPSMGAKTRSYGDLKSVGATTNGLSRRSSDPNMAAQEQTLTVHPDSDSANNSLLDPQSDREDSPDIVRPNLAITQQGQQSVTNGGLPMHPGNGSRTAFPSNTSNNTDTSDDECIRESALARTTRQSPTVASPTTSVPLMPASTLTLALNAANTSLLREPENDPVEHQPVCSQPTASLTNGDCGHHHLPLYPPILNSLSNGFAAAHAQERQRTGDNDDAGGAEADVAPPANDLLLQKLSHHIDGIQIQPKKDVDLNELLSVDLNDGFDGMRAHATCNGTDTDTDSEINSGLTNESKHSDIDLIWYGSMLTSTDTLVPVEGKHSASAAPLSASTASDAVDAGNGAGNRPSRPTIDLLSTSLLEYTTADEQQKSLPAPKLVGVDRSAMSSILPRVHNTSTTTSSTSSSSSSSQPTASSALPVAATNGQHSDYTEESPTMLWNGSLGSLNGYVAASILAAATTTPSSSPMGMTMDESIVIRPEHKKLDISLSGKYDTVCSVPPNSPPVRAITMNAAMLKSNMLPALYLNAAAATQSSGAFAYATQRRRRTSSSSMRRDVMLDKQSNGNCSVNSRVYPPAVRSLPMTPPGGQATDRQHVAISCPDGLAHALSEQNIRLQQIVQEHKLREEALYREIHAMRMTLLKKVCPTCNNGYGGNDDDAQSYAMDNAENASIGSWENVGDRSGPSSCATTSSSTQLQQQQTMLVGSGAANNNNTSAAASVPWVPDNAVSHCTTCQTVFWIGRRKHHCRNCGRIFCADCSEFWAALPEEKLLSPVRLCGSCYQGINELEAQADKNAAVQQHERHQPQQQHAQHHMQQLQQQQQQQHQQHQQQQSMTSSSAHHATPAATSRA